MKLSCFSVVLAYSRHGRINWSDPSLDLILGYLFRAFHSSLAFIYYLAVSSKVMILQHVAVEKHI